MNPEVLAAQYAYQEAQVTLREAVEAARRKRTVLLRLLAPRKPLSMMPRRRSWKR